MHIDLSIRFDYKSSSCSCVVLLVIIYSYFGEKFRPKVRPIKDRPVSAFDVTVSKLCLISKSFSSYDRTTLPRRFGLTLTSSL